MHNARLPYYLTGNTLYITTGELKNHSDFNKLVQLVESGFSLNTLGIDKQTFISIVTRNSNFDITNKETKLGPFYNKLITCGLASCIHLFNDDELKALYPKDKRTQLDQYKKNANAELKNSAIRKYNSEIGGQQVQRFDELPIQQVVFRKEGEPIVIGGNQYEIVPPPTHESSSHERKGEHKVSNFTQEKTLGEGTEANIFLVKNKDSEDLHVLKLAKSCFFYGLNVSFLSRVPSLALEARALKLLYPEHKIESNGSVIVMPYFKGQTIEERLKLTQSNNDDIKVLLEVLKAGQAMHQKGLFHGDLNPGNLIVLDNQPVSSTGSSSSKQNYTPAGSGSTQSNLSEVRIIDLTHASFDGNKTLGIDAPSQMLQHFHAAANTAKLSVTAAASDIFDLCSYITGLDTEMAKEWNENLGIEYRKPLNLKPYRGLLASDSFSKESNEMLEQMKIAYRLYMAQQLKSHDNTSVVKPISASAILTMLINCIEEISVIEAKNQTNVAAKNQTNKINNLKNKLEGSRTNLEETLKNLKNKANKLEWPFKACLSIAGAALITGGIDTYLIFSHNALFFQPPSAAMPNTFSLQHSFLMNHLIVWGSFLLVLVVFGCLHLKNHSKITSNHEDIKQTDAQISLHSSVLNHLPKECKTQKGDDGPTNYDALMRDLPY